MTQCHEIITDAVTGKVTEVFRDWTPEELAAFQSQSQHPTKEELMAKLLEIQAQLEGIA